MVTLFSASSLFALPMDREIESHGDCFSQERLRNREREEMNLKVQGEVALSPMDNGAENHEDCFSQEKLKEREVTNEKVEEEVEADESQIICLEDGYLLLPDNNYEESRKDEAGWSFVKMPHRKNPLSAYQSFAHYPKKIISHISINPEGDTCVNADNAPETFTGKVIQLVLNNYFFTRKKSFVDDYYRTLVLNYGRPIAEIVFPEEIQNKAVQFGLSGEIIFNSLKRANEEALKEILQELTRQEGSDAYGEEVQDNSSENQLDGPEYQKFQRERLCLIAKEIQNLLASLPDASNDTINLWEKNSFDNRGPVDQYAGALLNTFDTAMIANSSILWLRRAAFVLSLL